MKEKIFLTKEKETLLTPLYSKAVESTRQNPIFVDEKAREILDQIDYDFSAVRIPRKTNITLCIRASRMDVVCREFMMKHPGCVVLHPGCGLDSRFYRVDDGRVEWYDLDFGEVIELRRKFYAETERYHLIASPVMDLTWLQKIDAKGRTVLVVAEGLLMYLTETEVKELLTGLRETFPNCMFLFDAFSELTVRRIKDHPTMKKTLAKISWGVDNPKELESWMPALQLKEEWYFDQFEGVKSLGLFYRVMFRLAGLFEQARKAHRILIYE